MDLLIDPARLGQHLEQGVIEARRAGQVLLEADLDLDRRGAGSSDVLRDRDRGRQNWRETGAMPTQNDLGLDEDDRLPPRRQPPRTEEQLSPIDKVEGGTLQRRCKTIDLVATHGVLKYQLASGPDRVHGDGCDLARLLAWRQPGP